MTTAVEVVERPHKYMQLTRHPIDLSRLPIARAKQELEDYINKRSDGESQTWGYFPEYSAAADYSASTRLDELFEQLVLAKDDKYRGIPLSLAFVRYVMSEPVSEFGGLHIDVSPGVSHSWDPKVDEKLHILRLLFNLGTKPRRLDYVQQTQDELVAKGMEIPRDKYKAIPVAGHLALKTVEIPAAAQDEIYGLRFISSKILHAGTPEPSFLIAYGSYVNRTQIRSIFAGKNWGAL